MDLIQATKILKEKEKLRDKLLGQKDMLLDRIKELGYANVKEAQKELLEKEKELLKMQEHYEKGEERFITKFKHLLES